MDYDDLTTLRQLATTAASAKSYTDSKHVICNLEYIANSDNWQYSDMSVFNTKDLTSLCWFLKKEDNTYTPVYVKYGEKIQSIPEDIEIGVLIDNTICVLAGPILNSNHELLNELTLTLSDSYLLSLQDVSEEGL